MNQTTPERSDAATPRTRKYDCPLCGSLDQLTQHQYSEWLRRRAPQYEEAFENFKNMVWDTDEADPLLNLTVPQLANLFEQARIALRDASQAALAEAQRQLAEALGPVTLSEEREWWFRRASVQKAILAECDAMLSKRRQRAAGEEGK